MSIKEKSFGIVDDGGITTTRPKMLMDKLRKLRRAISKMGLFIFFVIYTVGGAKIFQILEHPTEVQRQQQSGSLLIEARQHFIREIVNLSRAESKASYASAVASNLQIYEEVVEVVSQDGVSVLQPQVHRYKWNFMESVFFASTVITTIGYGNVAPATVGGQAFCILYGFIGIPVALTVIADLGTIFANMLSAFYKKVNRAFCSTSQSGENSRLGDKTRRGLIVLGSVLALLVYLAIGACLFISWEEWTFFEAFYFCFITMTTIGLGDLVPEKTEFMLVCTLYILIGLALTSTIIELVRRQYAESWQQMKEFSAKLGELSGPLAEQLKKLGQTDLSLDLNLNSELKELRNAIQLSKLEALYRLEPKWRNDNTLADLLRSHFGIDQDKENDESDELIKKKKVVQIIIYESSV